MSRKREAVKRERTFLIALAACCAGPMLAIVILTSVVGVAVGHAAAVTLGVVAALVCVALTVQRHRGASAGAER